MKKSNLICMFFSVIAAVAIMAGCRKSVSPIANDPLVVEEIATSNNSSQPELIISADHNLPPTKSSPEFMFDWEQASTMPVAPGGPAIPLPWSDAAVKNYDPGLRYDFKKANGWELVYSNFSNTTSFDVPVFMLYNKFRGVLRYYSYNATPGNASVDSYRSLINEIALNGSSSPLLNYAGQYIVDVNSNVNSASIIEPWQISEGGWYIAQFEMAYDRNITNYNWPQFGMSWTLDFARADELLVNDAPTADKMIFLSKPGLRFSDNSSRGVGISDDMQLHVKSAGGLDAIAGVFSVAAIDKLKRTINDSSAGNLLNATLVPAQGIFDGQLDVKASLKLDYNLVGYVPGLSLAAPGMDNSKVTGIGPLFNEPMGVFYLASRPVVRHSTASDNLPEQYALDVSSVKYVINPFVTQYADVRNFRQEIVAVDPAEPSNLTEAKIYRGAILKASSSLELLGVRVSFEVVPKNGSVPVKIIKTFKADLQPS